MLLNSSFRQELDRDELYYAKVDRCCLFGKTPYVSEKLLTQIVKDLEFKSLSLLM